MLKNWWNRKKKQCRDKVKLFLKDKYNINFSDAQDDADNVKEIISTLDEI